MLRNSFQVHVDEASLATFRKFVVHTLHDRNSDPNSPICLKTAPKAIAWARVTSLGHNACSGHRDFPW